MPCFALGGIIESRTELITDSTSPIAIGFDSNTNRVFLSFVGGDTPIVEYVDKDEAETQPQVETTFFVKPDIENIDSSGALVVDEDLGQIHIAWVNENAAGPSYLASYSLHCGDLERIIQIPCVDSGVSDCEQLAVGVALDDQHNVFVLDALQNAIFKISQDSGEVSLFSTDPHLAPLTAEQGGTAYPLGAIQIVHDPSHHAFFLSHGNGLHILKCDDTTGEVARIQMPEGVISGDFLIGIDILPDGRIVVVGQQKMWAFLPDDDDWCSAILSDVVEFSGDGLDAAFIVLLTNADDEPTVLAPVILGGSDESHLIKVRFDAI